ncbi:hypothetical protein K0M31_017853 [Melipona bicolor]|uniref:Uncharacterized protein n=1 Tax=Melipona bicolor TaxID=60889 RepID=A0AA40G5V2_9HYME|nr:hypothetical protein K0M31_017853 [Melipona bicolor]
MENRRSVRRRRFTLLYTPRTRAGMVMYISTVRLVILLGIFLMFTGDYSYVTNTIFGRSSRENITEPVKNLDDAGGKPAVAPANGIALATAKKDNEKENAISRRAKMMATIKTACLPKLICELTSSVHQDQLNEMERTLLNLIR